ncbi:hypothetical protein CVT24_006491 [Panaeolus cyanescens]|uniref:Uncharacterized protein n=1 Tax=Panaeolus cyanescens TaxID=181874 RepID=A0A409WSW3_9AGAR|nr:hypothetical protein CVT24_006491 [Panaeolus cyanescens]
MDPNRRTTRSYTRRQQQTQQDVLQEDSDRASNESLHGITPPPPFTPAVTAPVLPHSASTVPMPGSFAPPAYNAANAAQTNPAVQATASTNPQQVTVSVEGNTSTRRSPNPFLTTTPMGTPQGPRNGDALQFTANTVTLVPEITQPVPTTPRITVPVQPANSTTYHSPGDSGLGNFGQSVTQTNLWEDNDSPTTNVMPRTANGQPRYRTPTMGNVTQTLIPAQWNFGSVNEDQGRQNLSAIPESEELEYVDDDEGPEQEVSQNHQSRDNRLPPLVLRPDIEDPQRRGVGVEELGPISEPLEGIIRDGIYPERYYYTFPSCRLQTGRDITPEVASRLYQRYREALQIGITHVERDVEVMAEGTRWSRNARIFLKDALQILETLFSDLYRSHNGLTYGYAIDEEIYRDLIVELLRLKRQTSDGFLAQGRVQPTIPKWGKDGDIQKFWNANDFEIISAVYRAEVERYLSSVFSAHMQLRRINSELEATMEQPRQRSNSAGQERNNPWNDGNREEGVRLEYIAEAVERMSNPQQSPTTAVGTMPAQQENREILQENIGRHECPTSEGTQK